MVVVEFHELSGGSGLDVGDGSGHGDIQVIFRLRVEVLLGGIIIEAEHSVFFGDELFSVLDRVDRNVLEGAEGSGASREAMHHVNSPVIGYQVFQVC